MLVGFGFCFGSDFDQRGCIGTRVIKPDDLLAGTSISCEISHVCNAISIEWVAYWKKKYLNSKRPFREWECGGSLFTQFWTRFVDFWKFFLMENF